MNEAESKKLAAWSNASYKPWMGLRAECGPQLALPSLPVSGSLRVWPSYWAASRRFLDELVCFLAGRRVLEVFAGNGLLAGFLACRGVPITATSLLSASMDGHERGVFHPVVNMRALDAVKAFASEHDVLLMSWPTVTLDALAAALEWERARRSPIVYIGEVTDYEQGHLGGCATDEFFERMQVLQEFGSYQRRGIERALVCRLDASL